MMKIRKNKENMKENSRNQVSDIGCSGCQIFDALGVRYWTKNRYDFACDGGILAVEAELMRAMTLVMSSLMVAVYKINIYKLKFKIK